MLPRKPTDSFLFNFIEVQHYSVEIKLGTWRANVIKRFGLVSYSLSIAVYFSFNEKLLKPY